VGILRGVNGFRYRYALFTRVTFVDNSKASPIVCHTEHGREILDFLHLNDKIKKKLKMQWFSHTETKEQDERQERHKNVVLRGR
jgi:hypothetical protein